MKITFIGAGNIGGATAIGFAASGAVKPSDITVTARHEKHLDRFRKLGLAASTDNVAAVGDADIVFFAVKPWQMEDVLKNLRGSLDFSRQLLVSEAPGVSSVNLLEWLGSSVDNDVPSIAYAIPNTAIEIGESMTFLSSVTASDAQMKILKRLFDKVGETRIVPMDKMLSGTCTASCGIAYAMRYISASAEGARRLGLEADDVYDVVCKTVKGASELISRHKSSPESEIDRVTTPNGLTIKGLNAMEDAGFSGAVIKGLTVNTAKRHRIVVKVGSNVLTREDGSLDVTRVSAIVDQVVKAKRELYDIVLVTSGAVACGRSMIREDNKLTEVQQRQLYSAIGQVRLMDFYYKLFSEYGLTIGQILTTKKNFSGKREYANQSNCIEVMLKSGIIPVVNENDTVSIKELMFTDNDELSGLVATMIGAEQLIILSNVDGIYTGDPSDPGSSVIRFISADGDINGCICESKSRFGRGGMTSKCRIAMNTAASGIKVIIANGKREHILTDLLERPESTVHTEFVAERKGE